MGASPLVQQAWDPLVHMAQHPAWVLMHLTYTLDMCLYHWIN